MLGFLGGEICALLMLLLFRKKYEVSYFKIVCLELTMFVIGVIGVKLGSVLSGTKIEGQRLYGMMMVFTITMVFVAKIMMMDVGKYGDYVSAPVLAVCAGAKVDCLMSGCCHGITIYLESRKTWVNFPSQFIEILVWFGLMVWILYLQRKGESQNLLWALTAIWFGVCRYLVDFFRGAPEERAPMFMGLPPGQLWSLIVLAMGFVYLYFSVHKYVKKNPKISELLRAALGRFPDEN